MFTNHQMDESTGGERRWGFVIFNLVLLWPGALLMALVISEIGWSAGRLTLFGLFVVLLAQVVYGFTLAATGWWLLRRGGDPVRINNTLAPDAVPPPLPATAIVMPIYNEDVGRVSQGLRVMFESLQATGRGDAFDFFILSDSTDLNAWIAEEKAWFELCKQTGGWGGIFYRKRRRPVHHKSGNIADFCRRWGAKYRYAIVLDADSVMTGATCVRLASLMEANPRAGIIQTGTKLALGRSLFQRINQFAAHACGPLFAAGANFWQLDNASYHGHNAIVRLKPFMKFCAMPELPPAGGLGTRVLSHDTVEAAFMRRAGYGVWSAYDLEGSYEETPPHLLASLQRDRRWCHGNLQHVWFLFAPGLTVASRVNILTGIMAYASSPLWLMFILASTLLFVGGYPNAASRVLFTYVLGLLLVPKLLGALQTSSASRQLQTIGSRLQSFRDMLVETICSMLLAPILMLFYTQFVWSSFFGGGVSWGHQKRTDDTGPSWSDLAAAHLGQALLAVAAGMLVAWLAPAMLPWLLLVLIGPVAAIPFARLLASNALGAESRNRGWFVTPEETRPPWELRQILEPLAASASRFHPLMEQAADFGLLQAVLDPRLNSLHVALLRGRSPAVRAREYPVALAGELLRAGPRALTLAEKRTLLWDAGAMLSAHEQLWSCPPSQVHEWWQAALRIYNQSSRREFPAGAVAAPGVTRRTATPE